MSEQPVVVQKISWQDLCPWTIIFRTLPIATSVTVMAFALLGVVLTPLGWLLSEMLFVHQEQRQDPVLMQVVELNGSPYRGVFLADQEEGAIRVLGTKFSGPKLVFQQLVRPFTCLFDGNWSGWKFCYFLLGSVWSLFVWSFVGLAIARVCLIRLTRNEQSGLDDAFEFAVKNWMTAAGAVGIPLLAVAALCIPAFIVGLFLGFDFGVVLVGIFWFVVLALAICMGLLLLGLMFGWPLMVSSVAAESQNSFDAMTRAFAYTFQRPINYVLYMLVAILFGGFCWIIVASLTDGVVELAYWSTSWGANIFGADRIDVIQGIPHVAGETATESSRTLQTGQTIIGLWNSLLRTIAAAFLYGLFWCMAAAIYLLLRKDVDETELDEIFVVDEKRTYDLPPLKSDENGIPQVQTLVAVDETIVDDSPTGGPNDTDGE